jgi:hypothetical protein
LGRRKFIELFVIFLGFITAKAGYRLRNGKITRFREYADTAAVDRAYRPG